MMTQTQRTARTALLATAALIAMAVPSLGMAANGSATATALVLQPLAIATTTNLDFGDVVAGNGTVTLNTSGVRSQSGSTAPLPSGGTPTAALFSVTGDTTHTFTIDYTGSSATLAGPSSNTMAITFCSEVTATASPNGVCASLAATGTLTAGAAYVYVGAQLVVDPAQVAGTYSGTIAVSMDYN